MADITIPKKKKKAFTATITFNLTEALKAAVEAVCERKEIPFSQYLRDTLREAVHMDAKMQLKEEAVRQIDESVN
jgi:hypothetical protein